MADDWGTWTAPAGLSPDALILLDLLQWCAVEGFTRMTAHELGLVLERSALADLAELELKGLIEWDDLRTPPRLLTSARRPTGTN